MFNFLSQKTSECGSSTPPGWDASPLHVTRSSPAFCQVAPTICRYPFIHMGGERQCDSKEDRRSGIVAVCRKNKRQSCKGSLLSNGNDSISNHFLEGVYYGGGGGGGRHYPHQPTVCIYQTADRRSGIVAVCRKSKCQPCLISPIAAKEP